MAHTPFEQLAILKGTLKPNATNTIDSFDGRYEFLSESYPTPIEYAGTVFPTLVHAFQASKTKDTQRHAVILLCEDLHELKRFSREVPPTWQWRRKRIRIRLDMLRQKFAPGSELAEKLMATGDAMLYATNKTGDKFWGVRRVKPGKWLGDNNDGLLLMQVRSELRMREVLTSNGTTREAVHMALLNNGFPIDRIHTTVRAFEQCALLPRAFVGDRSVLVSLGDSHSRHPITIALTEGSSNVV